MILSAYTAYGDGKVFQNVGIQNSDARESPERKNTTFGTQCKYEIKNYLYNI